MGLLDVFNRMRNIGDVKNTEPLENMIGSPLVDYRFKTDDWANPVTGTGTNRDKKMFSIPYNEILSVQALDSLYQSSVLCAASIDIPSYEMLRQGFEIKLLDGDNDPSRLDAFKTELQGNFLNAKITMGEVFSLLYGGSGIFLGVDDGLDPWDPLDYSKIRKVEYMTLLDRYELVNSGMIDTSVKSINFAKPQYYTLATIDPKFAGTRIHYSRIIRWDGIPMSRRRMAFFNYWGQSQINRLYNIIRSFESSHDAIGTMLQDFNTLVIEMKNLPAIIAGGNSSGGNSASKLFNQRIALATQYMSEINALILNEGEKASHMARTVTGMPELIDKLVDQVIMATKVPRLLLFGKGASQGQNANADGEIRMFYDYIRSKQINSLMPKLRKIVQVFMASKSGAFAGNIVPFQIEFNQLWQMDDKDKAAMQFQAAQSDNLNITNGIYTPEEARTRYENGLFSLDVDLDQGTAQKVAAANKQTGSNKPGGVDDPNLPSDIPDGDFSASMGNAASASESFPRKKI